MQHTIFFGSMTLFFRQTLFIRFNLKWTIEVLVVDILISNKNLWHWSLGFPMKMGKVVHN